MYDDGIKNPFCLSSAPLSTLDVRALMQPDLAVADGQ